MARSSPRDGARVAKGRAAHINWQPSGPRAPSSGSRTRLMCHDWTVYETDSARSAHGGQYASVAMAVFRLRRRPADESGGAALFNLYILAIVLPWSY